ncbi:MAG: 2-dehydro-3-deoxygalactonokinase [Hyphomicrobiales bacterium]|nr:2-dehydro-3-deoxygalactonokinase [Hyphomicrobiales bacterium]
MTPPAVPSIPDFVSVDWGTTSFRAYLVVDGETVAEHAGPHGILGIAPGGHAAVLRAALGQLPAPAVSLPIVMSGMIGSRQGWVEAPYVTSPASSADLAARLTRWKEPDLGVISLIPGVMSDPPGGMPDVMRGEETQVFGGAALMGRASGTFIMPGTHSKCIVLGEGVLQSFRSFMTGEMFAALKRHTILGRLMTEGAPTGQGFEAGVRAAATVSSAGDLMNAVFGARTLGLFERLPGHELEDYLSGLLIGAELCASLPKGAEAVVVGSGELSDRYCRAALLVDRTLTPAPDRCVVAGQMAVMRLAGIP